MRTTSRWLLSSIEFLDVLSDSRDNDPLSERRPIDIVPKRRRARPLKRKQLAPGPATTLGLGLSALKLLRRCGR